jgi:hypothetical protein
VRTYGQTDHSRLPYEKTYMREVDAFVIVSAPLRRDAERRRWYSEGADACVVLTRRGRLLEPHPIFGPTNYRVLARRASASEAAAYARRSGLVHERGLPPQLARPQDRLRPD